MLFLTLTLILTYLLGNRNRAIFNPEGTPYKRTYLLTYLVTELWF